MDSLFIIIIVIMLIFIMSILFFVYYTSIGIENNVGQIRSELERAQAPVFSPMGVFSTFMKFFLSFFKTK
jgi:flagellar basal body-associated protein FliL